MKKFLFRLFIVVLLIVLCDRTTGTVLYRMLQKTTVGDNGRNNRINHDVNDDIIFLGSSRCLHHYIPRIIEDSLGLTCYNAGTDGEGIILSYVHAEFILNRYKPKLIVYDIGPGYDYYCGDNIRHLKWLRCEYDEPFVRDVIKHVDKTEYYKMKSLLYRVNGNIVEIIRDYLHSPITDTNKGYTGVKKILKIEDTLKPKQNYDIDPIKYYYMERLITTCKEHDVPLIFYISPAYNSTDGREYEVAYKLAEKNGIPVFNHLTDSMVCINRNLFGDSQHLNEEGAEVYTKIVSKEIKDYLCR